MKHLQRFCSLLLCSVLLFGVFSVTANAAEQVEIDKFHVFLEGIAITSGGEKQLFSAVAYPHDGVSQRSTKSISLAYAGNSLRYGLRYTFATDDGSAIIKEGGDVRLYIDAIPFELIYENGNGDRYTYTLPDKIEHALLFYTDGSMEYVDVSMKQSGTNTNVTVEFTPDKDVQKVELLFYSDMVKPDETARFVATLGETEDFDNCYFMSYTQDSKEVGLLEGIIEWLRSVRDKVADVVDSITELPAKIWEQISNGLKSLFVPDEEYIASYKDNWSALMSEKLGAVYQVVDVTFGAWEDINASDEKNTIECPEVSIPLPDNVSFSFGGYEVEIVPQGFDWLATSCKAIVGIVATIAYINGLRKRYDEVMGVEK